MRRGTIISRRESQEILKNELRRAALERHSAELKQANAAKRAEILAQIEREVRKEVRRRAWRLESDNLLH